MASGRRYADLVQRFRVAAARQEEPSPELHTLAGPGERSEPLEIIALMTSPRRAMHLYAFDPAFDPRRAMRSEGERRISLTNYLNFAAGGARGQAPRGGHARVLAAWSLGADPPADTRVFVECEHIVAAHDFRIQNPAAKTLRVDMGVRQRALFWLDDGSVLQGLVFNLDQALLRAEEATFFFSVCEPVFYGTMASAPWGRGLPFLALNRRYVVAKKHAESVEDLEAYLAVEPGMQPPGFATTQLTAWERLPQAVRAAASAAAGSEPHS